MITDLDVIVKEWAYRTDSGKPNPKNDNHIYILSSLLYELKWPMVVIDGVIKNLREQESKFKARSKETGKIRYFKDKESMDNALDAGTVEPIEKSDKKDDQPQQDPTKLSGPKDFERPGSDTKSDDDIKKEPEETDSKEYLKSLDIELPDGLSDDEIESIVKTEKERRKFISDTVDILISQITQERGAGAYNVEKEDLEALKKFAQGQGPKVENYPINEDDLNLAYKSIEEKVKDREGTSLGKIRSALQLKGAADPDSTRVGTPENPGPGFGRRDKILESYLACGGRSVVTGRPISIGQSNVDHRLSLKNGGKDEPKNWVWMETNLNMLKKDLSDKDLIDVVNKELAKTPEEQREKKRKSLIKNLTKKAHTEHYKNVFEKGGNGGFTEDDIKSMTITQMKNIIRGWNSVYDKKSEFYVQTYQTQVGGSRADAKGKGGRGVALKREDLQKNMIEQFSKKEPILSSEEIKILDEVLRSQIEKIEKENQ